MIDSEEIAKIVKEVVTDAFELRRPLGCQQSIRYTQDQIDAIRWDIERRVEDRLTTFGQKLQEQITKFEECIGGIISNFWKL